MDAMKLINNLCEGYNAAADEPAMQELKPLPCPLCGSKEPKVNRGCGVVTCCEISVEDVAAWNKLPRALRWTHEPPKVAGWYYVRQREDIDKPWSKPRIVSIKTLTIAPSEYRQFAGPIPAPID